MSQKEQAKQQASQQQKQAPYSDLWAIEPYFFEGLLHDAKSQEEIAKAHYAFPVKKAESTAFDGEKIGSTAVIDLCGTIYRYTQYYFKSSLEMALEDSSIESIMVRVNSPGGLVAGTKELADFVRKVKRKKPMAVYVDGLCASAAMWIASAFGTIYAPATANLGSVGVISIIPNYSKMYESVGISYHYIQAGKWKSVGSPDKELSQADKKYLQERVEQIHTLFKQDIAKNLHLSKEESNWSGWAEAQVFLASEAKSMGFVKKVVQDVSEACALLQKKGGSMTREELQAEYPDLYQAVLNEGQKLAKDQAGDENQDNKNDKTEDAPKKDAPKTPDKTEKEEKSKDKAGDKKDESANAGLMTLLSHVLDAEQFANVEKIVHVCKETNTSFEQASAFLPFMQVAQTKSAPVSPPVSTEGEILSTLQKVSQSPLAQMGNNKVPQTTQKSALLADAERRI